MDHTPLFRYLRNCYQEDFGQSALSDVFQRKYEHRWWHSVEEELLFRQAPMTFVAQDWAETVRSKAFLYRKEKQLIYSFLFLIGSATEETSETGTLITAPLIWCPAQITEYEDDYYLALEGDELHCNDSLLAGLSDQPEVLIEALHGLLVPPIDKDRLFQACRLLEKHIDGLNHDPCLDYPTLADAAAVRAARRRAKPGTPLQLLPAALTMMVPKPSAARGVLTELEHLAEGGPISPALEQLLDHQQSIPTEGAGTADLPRVLPLSLSQQQQAILTACENEPLSAVIGPPGTGKSFTIAACALDQAARGHAVLITTRMDDGVDVIAEKCETISGFKDGLIRFGKADTKKAFKAKLEHMVRGMFAQQSHDLPALRRRLQDMAEDIQAQEAALSAACSRQLAWGGLLADPSSKILDRVRRAWTRLRAKREPPLWQAFQTLEDAYASQTQLARGYLRAHYENGLAEAYHQHRPVLQSFLSAVRARQSGLFAERTQALDWSVLFSVLPIWLGRITDCHEVLPLKPGLFDVAIVDEATLCDMASLLPVAQRAKRLCIVGDPYQLRHLSFVSRDRQALFARRHQLSEDKQDHFDFRAKSAMDLAETRATPIFLNEHFRGHPELIAFSNQTYYGDSLRVMTEKPGIHDEPRLRITQCDQPKRDKDGVNAAEVTAVIRHLQNLFGQEKAPPLSVGVLSPFRKQADALNAAISEAFPVEMLQRHRVMVGTPYSFQGQERDCMLLSSALCREDHLAAPRYLARGGVFNVSITRARQFQTLFCSVEPEGLPPHSPLRQYLVHINSLSTEDRQTPAQAGGDPFSEAVAAALAPAGVSVQTGVVVAGMKLDLLLAKGSRVLGLDLVGYPGDFADFFPIQRYHILARAGVPLLPLAYADWLFHQETCVTAILERLVPGADLPAP
ncbi:DEAD/DEAH box helicase [Acanthopleuribacter pedis]|uniref:DNA helicase n=1 Tax=Acanthopleuribacter pedis TaxID=442870 RepID=A0A8J7Q1J3_9BACT|nr:AAA domain-containing protein [Acanthopleuribacter pedis]MBO1318727.1 hypothetical protein [Acanthopleuribacter pedis]